MGVSIEASPDRPGHVGHTPQRVGAIILASRLRGVLSSGVVRLLPLRQEYAAQAFVRPQRFQRPSQEATLLSVEAMRSRIDPRQPWPDAFTPALNDPRLTRSPR